MTDPLLAVEAAWTAWGVMSDVGAQQLAGGISAVDVAGYDRAEAAYTAAVEAAVEGGVADLLPTSRKRN